MKFIKENMSLNKNLYDELNNMSIFNNLKLEFKNELIFKDNETSINFIKSSKNLLNSYDNIFGKAKQKCCKSIVSVSLGCSVNGYKHNDIEKDLISKLNELINKYDIYFMLVLPSKK